MERGGKIWTSDLLYLMEILGVSERAVRSALSRMARNDWLSSSKEGRKSQYALTDRGRTLLEKGARRIFEPSFTNWNGQWHLVLYSIPKKERPKRHKLRTQLAWLGFGRLASGCWISPHNRIDELNNILVELDAKSHVKMFSGQYFGPAAVEKMVNQCWDLNELEKQYQSFISRYQQEYLDCQEQHVSSQYLDPQICFVRRFWLTHEFQSIPLTDPNLPPSLLPPEWIGFAGRELFNNYRALLGTYATGFVWYILTKYGFSGQGISA
ncbi:MAG: hypothetical protein GY803_08445 [Chloroflexi bacterium]|nr:hypothetical protein [Chloroflexota bacterium]